MGLRHFTRSSDCLNRFVVEDGVFQRADNRFYEIEGDGLKISSYSGNGENNYNNYVYSNVFCHNGVGEAISSDRAGIMFVTWLNPIVWTAVKNNVFYENVGGAITFKNVSPADQIIKIILAMILLLAKILYLSMT